MVRDVPGGAEWLDRLPRLVRGVRRALAARARPSLRGGNVSLVATRGRRGPQDRLPATRNRSTRRTRLRVWDGDGAVRLLATTPSATRCCSSAAVRGRRSRSSMTSGRRRRRQPPAETLGAAAARAPFRLLANEAGRWADELPGQWEQLGRPFDHSLLDAAVAAARARPDAGLARGRERGLPRRQRPPQQREPWLVIDPKPIAAEREFTPRRWFATGSEEVLAGPRPLRRFRAGSTACRSDLGLDRERSAAGPSPTPSPGAVEPSAQLPPHAAWPTARRGLATGTDQAAAARRRGRRRRRRWP